MRIFPWLAIAASCFVAGSSCKGSNALFQDSAASSGSGGGSSASSGGGHVCIPGSQVACACPGGEPSGVQVCEKDGSGYGACSCGGTGGASASSSSSGTSGSTVSSTTSSTSSSSSASSSGASSSSASSSSSTTSSSGGPTCAATWSKGVVAADQVDAQVVATDAQGNLIVAGSFDGTVNFGGGPLVAQGIAINIFVAKYDCSGNHLWSKRFGVPTGSTNTDTVQAASVASDGSILLTGNFQGSIDFGTGPLTAIGTSDGYIAKLDAAGNAVFARSYGGLNGYSEGTGAAVDAMGNVYVSGFAYGAQNFGGGVFGVAGQQNTVVAEFDSKGNWIWSKAFPSTGTNVRLALDPSGNVVLAGGVPNGGQPNFGGGPLPTCILFAAELTSNGSYLWSKGWGSPGNTSASVAGLTTSPTGELVFTGPYSGTTLDFGGGTLPTTGAQNLFLAKLTNAGSFVFSKANGAVNGPSYSAGYAVAVNGSGEIYLTGGFGHTLDLGAGPVVATGTEDLLLVKFSPTGTQIWLKSFGTANDFAAGTGIALDTGATPFLSGYYDGSIDLGNGSLPMETGAEGALFGRVAP